MLIKKQARQVERFANVNTVLDTLEMNVDHLVTASYHQMATTGFVPAGFKAAKSAKASHSMALMNTITDLDALYANLDNG